MVGIKGFVLPVDCHECSLMHFTPMGLTYCVLCQRYCDDRKTSKAFERPEWCPLVKIREEEEK